MKSTEVSVFRGTNTVVAMSKISLPRKVLAVTTITSCGSWRNQRLHKLAPFVRRKASSMSVNGILSSIETIALARDLADYQRLTAEGKLGEAGQKLEELKRALDKLNARQR
jgi:hypothetical protein